MPTINQLVRLGRKAAAKKEKAPHFNRFACSISGDHKILLTMQPLESGLDVVVLVVRVLLQ